jgi:hypothetical protein
VKPITKRRLLSLGLIAVITISAAFGCLWSVTPLFFSGPFVGFRHLFPHRLIEPSLPGHEDTLVFALITEARARFVLVCISWLVIVMIVLYRHVRAGRALKT